MKDQGPITRDTPLYNSRTILSYFQMLSIKYPHVDQDDLCNTAGMRAIEVADPGHWFTQEQIDRFHCHLVKLTGNPNIAREAGQYLASADALGPIKQYLISFLSPAKIFQMLEKLTPHLTLTSLYTSRKLGPNKIEVVVSYHQGVEEKDFQCENRQGSIESVLTLFNYTNQQVEHPECIFKGGKVCRYIISWEERPSARFKKMRNLLFVATCIAGLVIFWTKGAGSLLTTLPWAALALALLAWWGEYLETKEHRLYFKGLRDPSNQLMNKIQSNYDHANVINAIGQAISNQTSMEKILQSVIGVMEKQLDYERGLIMLADPDSRQLEYRAGYGLTPAQEELLANNSLSLDASAPYGAVLTAFFEQQPQHIADTDKTMKTFPPISQMLTRELGVKSFLACPIVFNNQSLGVLSVDYANREKQLVQTDINLLMGIAPVLGVRMHNATLLEEQLRQNREIISLENARAAIAAEKVKSDRLAEDLQEINEELKNFTYIVSHDLRAPLVNIKGFSTELNIALKEIDAPLKKCREYLSEKETELLDIVLEEDIPEALQFINSSVTRMDGQINGILKLSRLGRRELEEEEVNLQELVEEIMKTLAHQLESHQAAVDIVELPTIKVDRVSLEQIFGNLLDNGVKYLESGRPGKIEVLCNETDNEYIFRFKDNGRGIDEADIDKVFAIFRRAGRQDTKGEGLGLAYVKTLVRRLGGRIWCESILGEGTTFSVALPKT